MDNLNADKMTHYIGDDTYTPVCREMSTTFSDGVILVPTHSD